MRGTVQGKLVREKNHQSLYQTFLAYENVPTSPDIDFDYTVSGDLWNKVMEAIREENEDKLKSCLQEVDEDIKKRGLVITL